MLNYIHEALADVTCHSDQTEILAERLSPRLLVKRTTREEYAWRHRRTLRWSLSRLQPCHCVFHSCGPSPPRFSLLPSDVCIEELLSGFVLGGDFPKWLFCVFADVTHVQRFCCANDVVKSFGSISSQMEPPTVHARLNPKSLTFC